MPLNSRSVARRIHRSSYIYKRTKCESPAGPRDGRVQDIQTPMEDD